MKKTLAIALSIIMILSLMPMALVAAWKAPTISHQPTAEEPYVTLDVEDSGATYQWYTETETTVPVTPENASTDTSKIYGSDSTYVDNKWMQVDIHYSYFFVVEMKAGETIVVTMSEAPRMAFFADINDSKTRADVSGNTITFTPSVDGEYALKTVYNAGTNDVGATAVITNRKEITPVENATSASYAATADGNYYCVVTLSDGTKLTSEAFEFVHAHGGGSATCNTLAKCGTCGKDYGEFNPDVHQDNPVYAYVDDEQHMVVYQCCGAEIPDSHEETTAANCMNPAYCALCMSHFGEIDADAHSGEYIITTCGDDQHMSYYTCCPENAVLDDHEFENGVCICGEEEKHKMTFMNGDEEHLSIDVSIGAVVAFTGMPLPSKDGFEFAGWYTADGVKAESPYTVTGSVVFYATWTEVEPDQPDVPVDPEDPDEPVDPDGVCAHCGSVHENFTDDFFCFIRRIINWIVGLFTK